MHVHSFNASYIFCILFSSSGREWSEWCQELRVPGDQLEWRFTSDGSVNGWGWKFTVYPVMPSQPSLDSFSDRTVLSKVSLVSAIKDSDIVCC